MAFGSLVAIVALVVAADSPDLVRLKSGAFFRGTISELVPGDHVTIVLVTGETRRIPMSEVDYAGPAAAADAPGEGPRTSAARGVQLKFKADEPGITFHELAGQSVGTVRSFSGSAEVRSNVYQLICKAPCEATLEPGVHRFALSRGDDPPVAANALDLQNNTTLEGTYRSYELVRLAGWVIGTGGVIAGAVIAIPAITSSDPNKEIDKTPLLIGLGVLIGSAVVGGILSGIDDRAEVHREQ